MAKELYHPNLDTLIHHYEARPESAARTSAWEWLSEQDRFTYASDALLVPSATWSDTTYAATPTSCTCEAHSKGRWCWHKEAGCIVFAARAEDAAIDAAAEGEPFASSSSRPARSAEERAHAYAAIAELFA